MSFEEKDARLSRRSLIKAAGVLALSGTAISGAAAADDSASNTALVKQTNNNAQVGSADGKHGSTTQTQYVKQSNTANVNQKAVAGKKPQRRYGGSGGAHNFAAVKQTNNNKQVAPKKHGSVKQTQFVKQSNKANVNQKAVAGKKRRRRRPRNNVR